MRGLAAVGLAAAVAVVSCHHVGPRLPVATPVRQFAIPWENAFPSDVAVDAEGRVWFTDRLTHVIGRFDLETGEFASFPTPTPRSAPYGIVAGPDGGLWFAESQASRLGRVDPSDGSIREYALPGLSGGPQLLVCVGGRLFFTAREGGTWGWYDPVSGEGRVYAAPPDFGPYGIAAAADGSVWIGGQSAWALMHVGAASDTAEVVELEAPIPAGMRRWLALQPDSVRARREMSLRRAGETRRIAVDGEGGVWLTDFHRSRVVRYDPGTGREQAYASLSATTEPYAMAVSRAGLVWYSEKRTNAVVVLDPSTGERQAYPLPTPNATVRQILLDEARGRVWLPMSDAGRLGLLVLRWSGVRGGRAGHGPGSTAGSGTPSWR